MREKVRYSSLVIAVLGGAAIAVAQSGVRWQSNLDSAKRLAAETNRLILLHFWTESCGPCMRMEREVFARPDVAAAIEANFVPVRINAQHFPMTAREFGVNAWPTDLIITPQGGLIYRRTGGSDAAQYVALLNQVAAAARNPGYQNYASANPSYPPAFGAPAGLGGATPPGVARAQWPAYPPQANSTGLPAGAAALPAQAKPWQPEAAQWNGGAYPAPGGYRPLPEQMGGGPRGPLEQNQAGPFGPPSGAYGRPAMEASPPTAPSSPEYGSAAGPYQTVVTPAVSSAPLGLDGYCAVSLAEKERWVKGDPRYGVIHRGRTYLFAGPEEANRFYADPDRYAPVMSGLDVVLAVEENRQVPGRREHGAWYERRVYLFASEATFRRFDQDPARYAAAAMQASTSMARRLPALAGYAAEPQAAPNGGFPPPARY